MDTNDSKLRKAIQLIFEVEQEYRKRHETNQTAFIYFNLFEARSKVNNALHKLKEP